MSNLIRNLGYSLRRLRKHPGLTIVILFTLALGIGANTAMFTVDYASMVAPIPYPNPDQLVIVWSKVHGERTWGTSAGDLLDWRRENSTFQKLDALDTTAANLSIQDQPEFINGYVTTPGLWRTRGVRFMLGRDFLDEEGQPGRDHVIILSSKLWTRLGSDPNILGKSLRLNGEPYTVVGVWAEDSPESRNPFAWFSTPLAFKPADINHDQHWYLIEGRLKPGVTVAQAQADMDRVTALQAKMYPADKGWGVSVEHLKNDFFPKEQQKIFWMLLGAVGFVLLIACVNIANLLLANGIAAQKEVALRIALGARRQTIFAQQLTESLILAITGGLLGLGVGYAMLHATMLVIPRWIFPAEAELRLNLPILITLFAVISLCGLLFGSIPAWYASRVSPGEAIKEGGRAGTGAGRHRLRRALVIGEFALALPLLAGAGLAIHSFWDLMKVDLGVRTDHVLTFGLVVPNTRHMTADQSVAYYRQMLDSIRSVSGVTHATVMSGVPMYGSGHRQFAIAGRPSSSDPSERPDAAFRAVSPEYFQTMGIPIVRGRQFNEQDTASAVKVVMVNQEFVSRYLQGMDPLQQRLIIEQMIPGATRPGPAEQWQIIGVTHDVRSAVREQNPEIEIPFWQSARPSAHIGVLTAGDPAMMTGSIAAAVHRVDPDIALAEPRTMQQLRSEVLESDSFMTILFGSFASVGLVMAGIGIYGVMAFSVAQRSHEIAIRMALGSGRSRVVKLVVREGLLLAGIGLALGLVGAYFVGRGMQSLLYGVRAMDYAAFIAVGLVLLLTALLACFLPARRAASVDPMQALRTE